MYPAPAKINLFLHIIGRRDDGYHNLQTAFQFLDLTDGLSFKILENNEIKIISDTQIPLQQNLIYHAAKLLNKISNQKKGVEINLKKNIPMGAGLGGGSSDAATTLCVLNHLWGINLPREKLLSLGKKLGADVPIFIFGHSAFAEGIGDQLTAITLPENWILLIIPPVHIPTAEIYNDLELTRNTPLITISEFLQKGGHNDFESVVCKRYPSVAEALSWLKQFTPAKLTGSGSGVFAQFNTQDEALAIYKKIPQNFRGIVARVMNKSPLDEFL